MLVEWIPGLAALSPELVWGVFTRAIGCVFIISFASLMPQVLPMAGKQGGVPVAMRLAKVRKDFAAPARFAYFPTLLWLSSSDVMLRLLTVVGLLSACVVVYGGPLGPYAMVLCYVCYLSLDMPMGLIFPWDCMLFETAILGVFLPATLPLPELASTAAPPPTLTWAYRLLVFRVMFGFGKNKFMGATKDDNGYLKGFLTAQPLPNPLGWYAQKAPMWVMKLLMVMMFVVEIPVPLFVFFPGDLSIVAAVLISILMVGIISFGSFGYFSLLTIAGCVPLFDNVTPTELSLARLFGPHAPNLTNAFVLAHTFGVLFVFPFNSWVGQSWSQWTVWQRLKPRFLAWPVAFLRAMHPFRWLHPYGVFPPKTFPSAKGSVIVEVSWDGQTWHECDFNYFACNERSRPRFVAPHHPRGDQAVIYETFGLNPTTLISSLAGPFDPYGFGKQPAAGLLCQRILEGRGERFVRCEAFSRHAAAPAWARVRTVLLEPASLEARRSEGKYWKRTIMGPHTPPRQLDPEFFRYFLPEPEQWHPDAWIWRRRSRLGKLIRRADAGEDVHALAIADSDDLTEADRDRFWSELIPAITPEERASWDTLQHTVPRIRARFDRATLHRLELIMGRYSALLEARLQPLYLGKGLCPPELPAKTYMHLWALTQHIMAQGRQTFERVYADPKSAAAHLETMTLQNGLYFLALSRFETMVFDAQKLRLVKAMLGPYEEVAEEELPAWQQRMAELMRNLFGYFEAAKLVSEHFQGPAYDHGIPEHYPRFTVDGDIVRLVGWPDGPQPGTEAQPAPGAGASSPAQPAGESP